MRNSEYSQCCSMKDMVNAAAEKFGAKDAFRWRVKKDVYAKTYAELKKDTERKLMSMNID